MTKLDVLKNSLAKKQTVLDNKISNHFDTVRQANGQPLNDKRNGQATIRKWDRQSDSIRNQVESIEKTERSIEIEEGKIAGVERANSSLPSEILDLVNRGELVQWRKYPNTFFVPGVDKARIVWDSKKRNVAYKYLSSITDKEQRSKFAKLYNDLYSVFSNK